MLCVQTGNSVSNSISKTFHEIKKNEIKNYKYAYWMFLEWDEHCLECSAPDCYSTCPLFCQREDGKCQRTKYGLQYISDNEHPGVRLKFSRWGKLEAGISNRAFKDKELKRYYKFVLKFSHLISKSKGKRRRIKMGIYMFLRRLTKYSLSQKELIEYDFFCFSAYSYSAEEAKLVFEFCDNNNKLVYKEAVMIHSGANELNIPLRNITDVNSISKIQVFPENNIELELNIKLMDIVTCHQEKKNKIKCLVWDCDETMWKGILADGTDKEITKTTIEIIKTLDQRGILQSIASKNDYKQVINKLEEYHLKEYFLFPQINWGIKSENIKNIVKSINIGMDSVAFIDDSVFERKEVLESCKGIRVFDAKEKDLILNYNEFDVAITPESKNRRKMYQVEELRIQERKEHHSTLSEFVRHCKLEITIFVPNTEEELLRCVELLNRTNQFNLSQTNYSMDEIHQLLKSGTKKVLAYSCKDRYGEYGIVGLLIFEIKKEEIVVKDYVMSCRVAKKGIENALSKALLEKYNCNRIRAYFNKTERNQVLLDSFIETGYDFSESNSELRLQPDQLSETIVHYIFRD